MKIRSISLEGFQSYYERETVDLAGMNLAVVIGRNGAGKSTLVDAVEWGLYGKFRGEVVKSVISRGAPRAEVTVEFVLNEVVYRVIRTRTATDRHEVVLQVADPAAAGGWRELTEKNPVQADPAIVELLGMTWATARATWIIGQGDFGAFCQLPPAQRRVVLANAFGLDSYAALAESAVNARGAAQTRLLVVQADLARLEAQVEALDADGPFPGVDDEALTEKIKQAETDAEEAMTALAALADPALESRAAETQAALEEFLAAYDRDQKRHAADVSRTTRNLTTATASRTGIETEHVKVQEAVWEVEDAQTAVTAAQTAVEKSQAAVEAAQAAVSVIDAAAAAVRAEQGGIKVRGQEARDRVGPLQASLDKGEGECFTCKQPLTAEQVQTLIGEQEAERAALLATYTSLDERLAGLQESRRHAVHTVEQARRAAEGARQAQGRAEKHAFEIVALADRVPQVEESLIRARRAEQEAAQEVVAVGDGPVLDEKRAAALREAAVTAAEKVREAQGGADVRQALRDRRDAARETERQAWAEQDRRVRVAAEKAALTEPLDNARQAVSDTERDLLHYGTLWEAFRPTGIPAMVLAGVVEELNYEANEVLASLSPSLSVNVATQREKAKGGSEEKVTVYVVTADGQVDYSTLSGSEKFRIALSLRIALSRCVARRTGTPIETIILDEGWGTLDEEFKRAVTDVLIRLSEDFSVFTVSHIDDVKDAFPVVISVDKDSGTSRVSVTSR